MKEGFPSYRLYNSIGELPLRCYKDVLLRDNLLALIREGTPVDMEEAEPKLREAWLNIQMEYADAIGDAEHVTYLKLSAEVTNLRIDLQLVAMGIEQIRAIMPLCDIYPDVQGFKDAINEHADRLSKIPVIGIRFDFFDKDNFENHCRRCINRSKGLKIELDLKSANLEAMQQKFEHGKLPDDNYFQSILINLSDHAGYHLSDNITVGEFANRLRRLMKHGEKARK